MAELSDFGITLIIKAPNQKICDQTVKCQMQWTVKQLKKHLSEVYPSQPSENQQRIIYSGRLLHDHLTLKEILKQGMEIHTMHLVCPPEKSSMPSDDQSVSSTSGNCISRVSSPESDGANIISSLSESELRSLYKDYYTYVYQWYHQQLLQYYSSSQSFHVETPVAAGESPTSQPAREGQEAAGGNEARPVVVPPAAMAAGPGGIAGEFDDENFERDWLDWFYYALRVAILIGLLNYYSSWSKILTALGILGAFFLYRFVFQRRNRPPEPQAPPPPPPPAQREAPGVVNEAETERPPEATEGDQRGDPGSAVGGTDPVAEGQLSLFRKILNSFYLFSQFFVTLITSLVPERIPPLDLD